MAKFGKYSTGGYGHAGVYRIKAGADTGFAKEGVGVPGNS